MSEYVIHISILILLYTLLAQSLAVCFGFGGLINLAHISFYAIGAYVAALLLLNAGLSFAAAALMAGLLAGLLAIPISLIAGRLKDDYFVVGTLAFSALISALLLNWRELTRGALGIPGIPRPDILHMDFQSNTEFLLLVVVVATFVCGFLYLIMRGAWGRLLRAQAESSAVAMMVGIDAARLRLLTLFLAAFVAGATGALFAVYMSYIDPSSFQLNEMVFVISIVVLGGLRSFVGICLAAMILVLIPEALRFSADLVPGVEALFGLKPGDAFAIPFIGWVLRFIDIISSPSALGPARQLFYALILLLMLWLRRDRIGYRERKA